MKLPELDLDVDAPDAFCVLAAMLTLQMGAEMAFAREPSLLWGIASVYVFGAALALAVVGITSIDVRRWGWHIATLAFTAVMVAVGMTYLMIYGSTIQTDTLGFIIEGANAILNFKSPYAVDMSLGESYPTPMISGGHIERYSYPPGSAIAVAPFMAISRDGGRLALIVATVVAGAIMFSHLPTGLAPLGLASLLIGGFATWGVNGLTDALWVAPLLGALVVWPWSSFKYNSLGWSAVLFGIATTMKQQPWFCAPFLFLWVWKEESLRRALEYAAISGGVFTIILLPSVLVAPYETYTGLFVNLLAGEGTLVHLGVGLSALTLGGGFPIAKIAHVTLMAGVGLGMIAAYWHWFDRIKWIAWIAWPLVLFVSHRSLANYFVTMAPLLVMILAARGNLEFWEVKPDAK